MTGARRRMTRRMPLSVRHRRPAPAISLTLCGRLCGLPRVGRLQGRARFVGLLLAAGAFVNLGELTQDVLRVGLYAARGFEVFDGPVLAPHSDEQRGEI